MYAQNKLISGEVLTDDTSLVLNEGRLKRELRVTSVCDRPIQVFKPLFDYK